MVGIDFLVYFVSLTKYLHYYLSDDQIFIKILIHFKFFIVFLFFFWLYI